MAKLTTKSSPELSLRTVAQAEWQIEMLVLRIAQARPASHLVSDLAEVHLDWLMERVLPHFDLQVDPDMLSFRRMLGQKRGASPDLPVGIIGDAIELEDLSGLTLDERGREAFGSRFDEVRAPLLRHLGVSGPYRLAKFFRPLPRERQQDPLAWFNLMEGARDPRALIDRAVDGGLLFVVPQGGAEYVATPMEALRCGVDEVLKELQGARLADAYTICVLNDLDQYSALYGGITFHSGSFTGPPLASDPAAKKKINAILTEMGVEKLTVGERHFFTRLYERYLPAEFPGRGSIEWCGAAFLGAPAEGIWPLSDGIQNCSMPLAHILRAGSGTADSEAARHWAWEFQRVHRDFVQLFAEGRLNAVGSKADGSGELTVPTDFWSREDAALDLVKGDFYVGGNVICRSIRVEAQELVEEALSDHPMWDGTSEQNGLSPVGIFASHANVDSFNSYQENPPPKQVIKFTKNDY